MPIIYILTNLKACYNRQLPYLGGLIQEAIRVEWQAIMLITKLIPNFEYYICTVYSISSVFYSEI